MKTATHLFPTLLLVLSLPALAQSIDPYDPEPGGTPTSLALQADGKAIIGGSFLAVGGATYTRVARLNIDGSVDATFSDPGVDGEVKTIAVQADGKLLVGGDFDSVAGQPRHFLARLDDDGTLDTGFADPNVDSTVWALAVQPDGKILAGGDFAHVGATARNYFARFESNGAFDPGFADPQLCCIPVRTVALQSTGDVLIGGYFSQAGGATHFYLARYSSSGQFDPSFPDPAVTASIITTMVVAPDDSVYLNATSIPPVIKLHADGTLDSSFNAAAADNGISTMALQPNGKLLIGGIFQQVGGQPRHALARLNADGTLDASFGDMQFSFDAGNPNGYVYGLAAQADGRIVAGGNFTLVDGQSRQFMARVATGDFATSELVVVGNGASSTVTWFRLGDGPEITQAPVLQDSTDGVTFSTAATMTRVANGWHATVNHDVHGPLFYLRALGTTAQGAGNAARGRVASETYTNDTIFHGDFE